MTADSIESTPMETKMDRERYDRYLAHFNARDYEAVLGCYADDFEIVFAGMALRGRDQMLRFYRFFHRHVRESITVDRLVNDRHTLAIEGRVRLECVESLTPVALAEAGYPRLLPLVQGQVVEIPQFIHYHVDAHGKFTKALCAVMEPAQ